MLEAASIKSLLDLIKGYLALVMPILMTLSVIWFTWAGIRLVRADDKSRDEAKQGLLWAVVALFVIVSVWGLVGFINSSTGIEQGRDVKTPSF